ncbi:hypothetical protein L1987_64884 [Smallanthus sonchifolius]|uniref:Uncharacterized protein n=1 Tax=Smallanthus sonchifolius TaxID=185202 RepID=A0ACB9BT63_9ASTR|nr:hypothetical protein L1987_64884 [Smallanthus sonchifolius]
MEDFCNSTSYSIEQGIPQIKAKVDGKDINKTEATLRKHLNLQDEGAPNSYTKDEYMRTFISKEEWMASTQLWTGICSSWSCNCLSSVVPADTDPTPSTSQPEHTTTASLDQTPVQPTQDAQKKKSKKNPSILGLMAQSHPKSPHPESQHSGENIKRDIHITRETSLEGSLLGSGPHLGSIVLIGLATYVPSPSSTPEKVHYGSSDRVDMDGAVTTSEARPKAPSISKDSTSVDEDSLKLQNLELTARWVLKQIQPYALTQPKGGRKCLKMTMKAWMLGSKSRKNVKLHSSNLPLFKFMTCQIPEMKRKRSPRKVARAVDEAFSEEMEIENEVEEDIPTFQILQDVASISRQFAGVQEHNWDNLSLFDIRAMHMTECINTSKDLSTRLTIERFHDICEDNMPRFERFLEEARRVAYPCLEEEEESYRAAQERESQRLGLIRSNVLTEDQVLCLRRYLYN